MSELDAYPGLQKEIRRYQNLVIAHCETALQAIEDGKYGLAFSSVELAKRNAELSLEAL